MKSKKMKQGMSWLLCMVMLLGNNVTVLAEEAETGKEGQTQTDAQKVSAQEMEDSQQETQTSEIQETQETENAAEQTEAEPEEEPVYNEAIQLRHEFYDEAGNVVSAVIADIQEGSFEADVSAISMEADTLTAEEDAYMQGLIKENLPEDTYLGDYVLYDVVFKVNGELTDPKKEIKLTYEGTGIGIQDVQDAVVCQYNVADPEIPESQDSVTEIIQRNDMIRYMEENGEDTSLVDDHDLSEIVLNEYGTAEQISMEVRKSSIFGCYVEEQSQETTFSQEVNGTNITVAAPEGAFGLAADQVTMDAAALPEEQAAAVEEQLKAQAADQGLELKGYAAFDISLWADGEEIQPQKPVTVTVENTGLDAAAEINAFQIYDQDNSLGRIANADENGVIAVETGEVLPIAAAVFGEPEVLEEEKQEQESDEGLTEETVQESVEEEIPEKTEEDTSDETDEKDQDDEKVKDEADTSIEEDTEKETDSTKSEKEDAEKEDTEKEEASKKAETVEKEDTDDKETKETTEETVSEPLTLTEEKDGVTVILTAPEGAFPVASDQVSMTVEDLTQEQRAAIEEQLQAQAEENGQELKGYVAYDIRLWANGEEIQPQVPVSVTFENAGLDVEDAETTEGFQLDEETETLNNIEGSVTEDGNAVVEAEHFTPTGVGSFGTAEVGEGENTVQLAAQTENIADQYLPSGNVTNAWQIVSGQYTSDTQAEMTENEMFRIQKNIIPTETENEFYVYLNVEPSMSWDELFSGAVLYLNNAKNETSANVYIEGEGLTTRQIIDKLAFNSHTAKIVYSETEAKSPDNSNQSGNIQTNNSDYLVINIWDDQTLLYQYRIDQKVYYGLSGKNYTLILHLPFSNYYVKSRSVTEVSENGLNGLQFDIDARYFWQNPDSGMGDLKLLMNDVVPTTIQDKMGNLINYTENSVVLGNAAEQVEAKNGTLTWTGFEKAPVSSDADDFVTVQGDDGKTHIYKKNAYQMLYKISLDVTDPAFISCAEEIYEGKTVGQCHYITNETTQMFYKEVDRQGNTIDGKGNEGPIDFISPVVRGLLYDIEFQKTDADTGNPLSGASFSLVKGEESVGNAESDSEGMVKFRNLPWGTYTLEETQAPDNYIKDYAGESVTVCYTTDRSKLVQDHTEPHSCDAENDIRNMLYGDVGTNGQITNKPEAPDPGEDPDNPTNVPHQKQIDWLGDSGNNSDTTLSGYQYYRLYLDATGIPDRIPEGADIIFILDTSNSMNFNMAGTQGDLWDDDKTNDKVTEGTRRLDYVKSAAIEAISTIKEASNQAAPINIGVVTFNYGNGRHYHDEHEYEYREDGKWYGYHNGTKIFSGFTNNYDNLMSSIEELNLDDLDGRTNYEAAFSAANELLNTSTQDNKYIVFITDGETNGYTSGGFEATGFGGNDIELTNQKEEFVNIASNSTAIQEANAIAKNWKSLSGFYTIAVSTDVKSDNLKKLGPDGVSRLDIQAVNENAIHDAFNSVISAITKQICDVTITDELSQYVEFVNHKGVTLENKENISADDIALKVTKTVNDRTEVIDSSNYTAKITTENGKQSISVNFGQDYFLEPGAKYTISFNVKLTSEAYNAEESDFEFGELGTDYTVTNNATSSGKAGLYSNDKAEITYSTVTAGELKEYTDEYPKPVVQKPDISTVQVKKIVDNPGGDAADEFVINLTSTDFSTGLVLGNGESKEISFEGQSIQLTVTETVPMEYQFVTIKVKDLDKEEYLNESAENGSSITVNPGDNLLIEVHNEFSHTDYFHDKDSEDNQFGGKTSSGAERDFLKPDPVVEGGDEFDEIL